MRPSTYSVGLAYELLVLNTLRRHGLQLVHTGGTGDKGQDFTGFWTLSEKRVSVVGQCKCYRQPVGPADIREFEDVLFRKFTSNRQQSVNSFVGIVASKSWFTASALGVCHSSRLAMILSQITPPAENGVQLKDNHTHSMEEGVLREFVLNSTAQKILRGAQVLWRTEPSGTRHLSIVHVIR